MIGIALIPNADGSAYDLDLSQGGMTLMEVTHQNQAMLLAAQPGEYKEYPAVGVGITDMLLDHNERGWRRRIAEQLEADGQRIKRLEITNEGINLEADYK